MRCRAVSSGTWLWKRGSFSRSQQAGSVSHGRQNCTDFTVCVIRLIYFSGIQYNVFVTPVLLRLLDDVCDESKQGTSCWKIAWPRMQESSCHYNGCLYCGLHVQALLVLEYTVEWKSTDFLNCCLHTYRYCFVLYRCELDAHMHTDKNTRVES